MNDGQSADIDWSERFPVSFFENDPLVVARELLGAILVYVNDSGLRVAGRIVETEAYRGEDDQACHARFGKTKRTSTMYGPPGRAYVYLIYGIYHMLNVVTWPEDHPAAVLIRGVEPLFGVDLSTDGPGKLCRAFGISRELNGADLCGDHVFIVPCQKIAERDVATGPRIGVDYAGDWANRPWRFAVRGNRFVSRPRL